MIQIFRSPSLEQLVSRLAGFLNEHQPADPLEPATIIVPNMDTARWMKLLLAEKNGISANIDAMLPADWFWRQIRKIYPELPEVLPSDLHPMKWTLFELLGEEEILQRFTVIERYVSGQPDSAREQALFQLCGQLASVFDAYQVYRPEMLLRWQSGDKGEGDEKWQAELWQDLNHTWRQKKLSIQRNRAELFREVLTAVAKKQIEADNPLFILNPGLLPMPIARLISESGKNSDVFLFQILLTKEYENNQDELIQAYGREGESADDVIKSLDNARLHDLTHEVGGDKLLNQLQNFIFEGKPTKDLDPSNDDISGIEIRSCHSPLREIEVLHQFLLEAFEKDDSLHPDDILVATPDLETYRPYIKAVFDQEEDGLPRIPYYAGYAAGNSGEGMERALIRLLALIDSRFEYAGVLDLFQMRTVYEPYGLSESDAGKVGQWMEENNVVWGLNADHRKEFDQPADAVQTWESALRRGWYGHFLGGEGGDKMNDLLLYPALQSTGDQEIWAAFTGYLNRLSIMRREIKRKRNCSKWADWLSNQMELIFGEEAMSRMEAQRVSRMIGQIREQCETGGCREEIPFSIFKNELISKLNRQKASGALFTNGVTFSSMVPVRSMPFRVIALIGLNENTFPRKKVSPDFDLMAQNPMPGERNRKHEDRNLFLESIMAAGDVHYCSYIGQSREDNEEIPPSTIVNEWVDILSGITGRSAEDIIKKEALSGYSPVNFQSNRSYSRTCFQASLNMLKDEEARSGLHIENPLPQVEDEETVQVNDLVRFFNNPVQWFLKTRFDADLREPGRGSDEFTLDHLESHLLFQRVFGWMMNGMNDRQIGDYLMQSGSVPAGWAGEREVLNLRKNVESALAALESKNIDAGQFQQQVSLRIGGHELEGELISYSSDRFADVVPSKFSGKVAIGSWIRHLIAQAGSLYAGKESVLFCELKNGEPKVKRFTPVEDPSLMLGDMIDLYKSGLAEPQLFFPKTLFTYEEAVAAGKSDQAGEKAAREFNPSDFAMGESSDLYIKTLLGEDVEFQSEFINERHRKIITRMLNHMEED